MVMSTGPDGRKQVDLGALPAWARWATAIGTVLVVVVIAVFIGAPAAGPYVLVPAVIGAVIAFAFIAWRALHP
jgi:hypothetical protein